MHPHPIKRKRKLGKHFSRKHRRLEQPATTSTTSTTTTTTTAAASVTAATAKTTAVKKPSKSKKRSRPTKQPHRAQPNDDGGDDEDPDKRNAKRLEKLLGIKRQRTASSSAKTTQPRSYKDVFADGDDDLVDLLNFCDDPASRAKDRAEEDSDDSDLDAYRTRLQDMSQRKTEDSSPTVPEESDDEVELAREKKKPRANGDGRAKLEQQIGTDDESGSESDQLGDDYSEEDGEEEIEKEELDGNEEGDEEEEEDVDEDEEEDDDDEVADDEENAFCGGDNSEDDADIDDQHSDVGEVTEQSTPSKHSTETRSEGKPVVSSSSLEQRDEATSNIKKKSKGHHHSATTAEIDAKEQLAKSDSSSGHKSRRYIPPGARNQNGVSTDTLKRRLRGLLNRVADINACGIADNIIDIFHSSQNNNLSRRELAEIYANAAIDASRDGSGIGQINPYVQSHAAIASHLSNKVDGVILASVIVITVRRVVNILHESDGFHPPKQQQQQQKQDEALQHTQDDNAQAEILNDEGHGHTNEIFGYVALLCGIFSRGGLSTSFIYDLIKKVTENLNTLRLEVLLFILRDVGALLRSYDPAGLKEVIEFIHEKANHLNTSNSECVNSNDGQKISQMKLSVMLDLVNDIKNNRVKKSILKQEQLRFDWATKPNEPLNASINDLLDDEFISFRWWDSTKGLSISELRGQAQNKDDNQLANQNANNSKLMMDLHKEINESAPDLNLLATSLRLNTDYRRVIFKAIMSSANLQDTIDRFETVGAFDTKNSHDKDTALVILHCSCCERSFNPFYSLLAETFCKRSRRLRFTFEFALWDMFKTISATTGANGKVTHKGMSSRKKRHLANLMSRLWASNTLSLSVLRKIPLDFNQHNNLDDDEKEFYIDCISRTLRLIVKAESEEKVERQPSPSMLALFDKLAKETWEGSDDFRLSFAAFLKQHVTKHLPADTKALCAQGASLLERGK